MTDISNLHRENFQTRLLVANGVSALIVSFLEMKGHWKLIRPATLEEDKEQAIDFWVQYPNDSEPTAIQMKLRDKQVDVPVVRFQPMHGIDNDRTVVGRDFKGIMTIKKTKYVYVVTRDKRTRCVDCVYRATCDKLRLELELFDEEWKNATTEPSSDRGTKWLGRFNYHFFTTENVQDWLGKTGKKEIFNRCVFKSKVDSDMHVWWKKNRDEAPKLNMYIPSTVRDWTHMLTPEEGAQLSKLFANGQLEYEGE